MKKSLFLFSTLLFAVIFTSCGPYKQQKWKDVGTNETAFMIPMEQATKTGQTMLKSVDYLEQKKWQQKEYTLSRNRSVLVVCGITTYIFQLTL